MAYFDHSATTPIHPKVLKSMDQANKLYYGNPSSVHGSGRKSKSMIESARSQVAKSIEALNEEIIFTGSGSESNNMVLWSLIHGKKKHVITSCIEHPAITKVLKDLSFFGITFSELPVDQFGQVNPDDLQKEINKNTGLVSIMMVNNEIGTIQPIKELALIAKENNIPFHSDTVQALGKIPLSSQNIKCDFLSFSAHKFYGPKGVGFLYKSKEQKLKPLTIGGSQEQGHRAGTENVPGIIGLGVAADLASNNLQNRISHLTNLENRFKENLDNIIPNILYNGHPQMHLPGVLSVSFPGIRSDILLAKLDRLNMEVSSGSACGSGSVKPSKILKAIGLKDDINICTLRISFGRENSTKDIDRLTKAISTIINE